MPQVEKPKHTSFCWDFLTPVNYDLTLSFLFFPFPTSVFEAGSSGKSVSSEERRRGKEENRAKDPKKRDKVPFALS